MIKFIKKNQFYIGSVLLFILLWAYGNNMEFYDNTEFCKDKPDDFPNYRNPYLDPTDDE